MNIFLITRYWRQDGFIRNIDNVSHLPTLLDQNANVDKNVLIDN